MNSEQDIIRKADSLKNKADSGKQIIDSIILELEKSVEPNWVEILERSSTLFQHLHDLGLEYNDTLKDLLIYPRNLIPEQLKSAMGRSSASTFSAIPEMLRTRPLPEIEDEDSGLISRHPPLADDPTAPLIEYHAWLSNETTFVETQSKKLRESRRKSVPSKQASQSHAQLLLRNVNTLLNPKHELVPAGVSPQTTAAQQQQRTAAVVPPRK